LHTLFGQALVSLIKFPFNEPFKNTITNSGTCGATMFTNILADAAVYRNFQTTTQ
jgi:hypothetical protein